MMELEGMELEGMELEGMELEGMELGGMELEGNAQRITKSQKKLSGSSSPRLSSLSLTDREGKSR
jgi:hypothetical protein